MERRPSEIIFDPRPAHARRAHSTSALLAAFVAGVAVPLALRWAILAIDLGTFVLIAVFTTLVTVWGLAAYRSSDI